MICFGSVACILYCVSVSNGVNVKIDGLIDLGPSWNYEYKVVTTSPEHKLRKDQKSLNRFERVDGEHKTIHNNVELDKERNMETITQSSAKTAKHKVSNKNKEASRSKGKTKNVTKDSNERKQVTELLEEFKYGAIYATPRIVRKDEQINTFTSHIFKQTLKVFEKLRQKMSDYRLKKQIDFLSRSYETKFKEFIKDTRKHKIKTRLGTQKVILNTIDASNRIMKRLINFLIGDMEKNNILRNSAATSNIFQKEVERETNLEYNHACTKFGICRTSDGFSEFLSEMLIILMRTDDTQFKLAVDTFTEVFKNADFSKSLDEFTLGKLAKNVEELSELDVQVLRALAMITSNIINNKNRPLIVHNMASARINQTLALLQLIDIADKNLPKNEANTLEWNDIKNSFQQWADGKRNDILEIMESLVNVFKKSLESLKSKVIVEVESVLNMVF